MSVRRLGAGTGAVLLVLAAVGAAMVTTPASSPAPESVPVTTPSAGTWTTNGKVWDLVRVGGTIFLGGEFTRLVSADGSRSAVRSNLAAISAATGQPLAWAPATNGAVLSLESSADGSRIFVGGNYTTIGGVSRSRLASVRVADGAVDTAFRADAGGRVRSLLRQGNVLFAAGEFVAIGGVAQARVARLDARTGAVATGWNPVVSDGAVRGMTLSPDGTRLYLGGSFTSVDGAATTAHLVAVTTTSGNLTTWRAPVDQPLFDVAATGNAVYLAVGGPGVPNNRLEKHDATTGAELLRYHGDGDVQDLEIFGDTLYVGGHSDTDFDGLERTMLVAVDLHDDHVLDYDPVISGLYGVWKVLAGPEGVWIAGEFTQVGGLRRPGFAFLPAAGSPPPDTRALLDHFGPWRYRTSSAPAGWSARTFDASTWASGRAEIGYGDGDESTVVGATTALYARRTFTVANRTAWRPDLHLRVLADAGAAVYLNGTEVARENLPGGTLSSSTVALGGKWMTAERRMVERDIPASLLVNGTNAIAVEVHAAANPDDLSFALELIGEPRTASVIDLVGGTASWRYRDTGVAPPPAWRQRSFDHTSWRQGRGQLGAGESDQSTSINRTAPAHVTDWYRLWFPVTNKAALRWVDLRLLVDDGAVVYVNGTEVARDNLPRGTITASTPATSARSGAAERAWRTFSLPRTLLVQGSNLLAVEVHQTVASDTDASFAVRVIAGV